MEGPDVVVFQVDLDEGLPVVLALVDVDAVEHVTAEVEARARREAGEIGADVAVAGVEEQAVPALQRLVAQAQAGIVGEVRRPEQAAVQVVGPAVQRAHDGAAARRAAPAAQDHGLAMAADVGDQFDAGRRAHEGAPLALLEQRQVVPDFGHREFVAEVARAAIEDRPYLAAIQLGIEIGRDGQLRTAAFERLRRQAQVGHVAERLQSPGSERRRRECAGRPERPIRAAVRRSMHCT